MDDHIHFLYKSGNPGYISNSMMIVGPNLDFKGSKDDRPTGANGQYTPESRM